MTPWQQRWAKRIRGSRRAEDCGAAPQVAQFLLAHLLKEAHAGLAEMYVADERFTAYYDDQAGQGQRSFSGMPSRLCAVKPVRTVRSRSSGIGSFRNPVLCLNRKIEGEYRWRDNSIKDGSLCQHKGEGCGAGKTEAGSGQVPEEGFPDRAA